MNNNPNPVFQMQFVAEAEIIRAADKVTEETEDTEG